MYEEIDRSRLGNRTLIAIVAFIALVTVLAITLRGIIGVENLTTVPLLAGVIVFGPFIGMMTGTVFGVLRKRAIRINVDGLQYTDEVRDLKEFGQVYHEGDFSTTKLGGHPAYACGWVLLFAASIFMGVAFILGLNSINGTIAFYSAMSVIVMMYLVTLRVTYEATPISSPLVNDPLDDGITKYLSKIDSLEMITSCDIIDSIIVRYREGRGQSLKVIADIRVCAITMTQPPFEIEITIEGMESIGPEYTYWLSQSIAERRERNISVEGKTATLTIGEENMQSYLRLRYDLGSIRAKWALGTESDLCGLMHALLEEMGKYEDFIMLEGTSSHLQVDDGG